MLYRSALLFFGVPELFRCSASVPELFCRSACVPSCSGYSAGVLRSVVLCSSGPAFIVYRADRDDYLHQVGSWLF